MKTLFGFIIFLLSCLSAMAQDQLFKRDNSKLEIKVLEITPTEIKYKLFSYPDGPTIVVAKSEVVMIIYQNGQRELFEIAAQQTVPATEQFDYAASEARLRQDQMAERLERGRALQKKTDSLTATKNWIFINMFEYMNGGIGFGYMREFARNRFDVTIQGAVGFTKPGMTNVFDTKNYGANSFDYDRKTIELTAGFNVHTTNTRPITHFIGPLFSFSQFNGKFRQYNYYNPGTPTTNATQPFVMNRYSFFLNNGILFRISPHLNAAMNMAVGFSNKEFVSSSQPKGSPVNDYDQPITDYVRFGFCLGYRF